MVLNIHQVKGRLLKFLDHAGLDNFSEPVFPHPTRYSIILSRFTNYYFQMNHRNYHYQRFSLFFFLIHCILCRSCEEEGKLFFEIIGGNIYQNEKQLWDLPTSGSILH